MRGERQSERGTMTLPYLHTEEEIAAMLGIGGGEPVRTVRRLVRLSGAAYTKSAGQAMRFTESQAAGLVEALCSQSARKARTGSSGGRSGSARRKSTSLSKAQDLVTKALGGDLPTTSKPTPPPALLGCGRALPAHAAPKEGRRVPRLEAARLLRRKARLRNRSGRVGPLLRRVAASTQAQQPRPLPDDAARSVGPRRARRCLSQDREPARSRADRALANAGRS